MALTFKGGIHPESRKKQTARKAIELLPAPQSVTLPMSMHIGTPCEPRVQVGERVRLGQKIADSEAPVSAPVHATVSGTVREIAPKTHPNGGQVLSVVIDNDFRDTPDPSVRPMDSDTLPTDEILRLIGEAGIVGHGGAAFPTHVKLRSALDKVDSVLINAAECEPYLTADHRLLLEYPWELMGGIKLLRRILDVRQVKIGLEYNMREALPTLREYLPPDDSVALVTLATKYPQGSEKQLISAMLGRAVPPGRLPMDIGALVLNVDTVCALYRLFQTGMPMVRRIVTVSGSAVSNPKNLEVRIGTPVEDLLEACGGTVAPPRQLIMGGPMMGVPLFTTQVPVIKGTNGILAFCQDECVTAKDPACIRCGKCLDACPMGLMPVYLSAAALKGTAEQLDRWHVTDCTECGACTYICPGKMPLVQAIRTGKARVEQSMQSRG